MLRRGVLSDMDACSACKTLFGLIEVDIRGDSLLRNGVGQDRMGWDSIP